MGKYAKLTALVAENMISGSSFKANGETVTINEDHMKIARDKLGEVVRGMMRDHWRVNESEDDSLSDLDDQVKIEELMDKTPAGKGTVPSLGESLNFNIKSLVEGLMDSEPTEDDSMVDGDENFSDAAIGQDAAGTGDDLDGDVDNDPSAMGGDNMGDNPMDADVGPDVDDTGDGFDTLSFADLELDSGDDVGLDSGVDDSMSDDIGSIDDMPEDEVSGDEFGTEDDGEDQIAPKPFGESKKR